MTGPRSTRRGAVALPRLYDLLAPGPVAHARSRRERRSRATCSTRRSRRIAGPPQTRERAVHAYSSEADERRAGSSPCPQAPSSSRAARRTRSPRRPSALASNASPPQRHLYYLFKYHLSRTKVGSPELTGTGPERRRRRAGLQPDDGEPIVRLSFHSHGDHEFQTVTRRLYQRGQLRQSPQHFAIVLDRDIESFPQIDYTDSTLSDGISGGAQITGVTTSKEAQTWRSCSSTARCRSPFTQVERSDVSATLGADSLQQAKTAAIVGAPASSRSSCSSSIASSASSPSPASRSTPAFLYAAILILNVTSRCRASPA